MPKKIIVIVLLILCVLIWIFAVEISVEIEQKGLKGIVEEIWEGTDKSK